MTTFTVRSILLLSTFGLAVASANPASELWFRAKFGRSSPAEEARQRTEMASTAFRTAPRSVTAPWTDEWFRAKHGRPSPSEQARLDAEQASSAFRQGDSTLQPNRNWFGEWHKARFGRNIEP